MPKKSRSYMTDQPNNSEILNLNAPELDVTELEQRLELAALGPMSDEVDPECWTFDCQQLVCQRHFE